MRCEDTAADVWLPIPADEIEDLPEPGGSGLNYRFWDGGPEFPADPAHCAFYVVPYMKGSEIAVRPLAAMTSVRVVQTLSAGIDHVTPASDRCGPASPCATPRASTRPAPPNSRSP